MIIYREMEERLPNQDRRQVKNALKKSDSYEKMQNANTFYSGNNFESLAQTNPELFSRKKLKAIQESKNFINDFSEYYFDLALKVDKMNPETEGNVSNRTMFVDLYRLMKELGDDANAQRILFETWIPEQATEEQMRKLIQIRLKNNQILTSKLTNILKSNYQLLEISELEAEQLISNLNSDDQNHNAIGRIKSIFADEDKMKKFKIGKNNYDFRSIGGACIFLSDSDDIKFSYLPNKALEKILKYDCIVSGHGGDDKKTSVRKAKNIADKDFLKDRMNTCRKGLKNVIEYRSNKVVKEENKSRYENTSKIFEQWLKVLDNIAQDPDSASFDDYQKACNFLKDKDIMYYSFKQDGEIVDKIRKLLKQCLNYKKAKVDPKTAMKNGSAIEWTIEPVDTLKSSGLDSVVDLVRQLKAEGFKNVLIDACNPGHHSLPKDIRDDPDFKVTYATNSIFIEFGYGDDDIYNTILEMEIKVENMFDRYGRDYENVSLEKIYEACEDLNNKLILTEGFGDALKGIIQKAGKIIAGLWNKVVNAVKSVVVNIRKKIKTKFDKNYKLEKPTEVNFVQFNGKKPELKTVTITNTEELEKIAKQSNDSIQAIIIDLNRAQDQWVKKAESAIAAGKYGPKSNGKLIDVDYREVKESAIFRNIQFI